MSIIGLIYTHTHKLTMYLILLYNNKIFFKVTICHSNFRRTFFTDFITIIRIKYNIIIKIVECYFKRGKTNQIKINIL